MFSVSPCPYPDLLAKFIKGLRKEEDTEGTMANLHSELSKVVPMGWRKEGVQDPQSRDRVSLRQDATVCELEICGLAVADTEEYSCVCGQERTLVMLIVRDKNNMWPTIPMIWCPFDFGTSIYTHSVFTFFLSHLLSCHSPPMTLWHLSTSWIVM